MSRKVTRSAAKARPRPRVTFFSVVGELLLTAGAILGLFVVWQMWLGDVLISHERYARANELVNSWVDLDQPLPPSETDATGQTWYPPPVIETPREGVVFGTIQIPRFGTDYRYEVAGGTTREITLDDVGVGVYENAAMPGQIGNFSVAGHRAGWGGPFQRITELRIGDPIVFETPEGWYTYRFRDIEYVTPRTVEILAPVPHEYDTQPHDRLLTMTACSPLGSTDERVIAYGVFDSFQPRAEGPPAALEES